MHTYIYKINPQAWLQVSFFKYLALATICICSAGPASAQGLCENGIFSDGLKAFFVEPRGIFLCACLLAAVVWGWFGLAMAIVLLNAAAYLLPMLTGTGLDLTGYYDLMQACGSADFLFLLGISVFAVLFLRDGFFKPRKPR
jgi:hypothetical protein